MMQQAPPKNTFAARAGKLTVRTLWPQIVSGLVFAYTIYWAARHPENNALIFVAGSGSVFALTLAYLYSIQTGRQSITSLLTWIGGLVLMFFSALVMPQFLAFGVVFAFASVCYGLGASSRRAFMAGTLMMWLALACYLAIYLLVSAGGLQIGAIQVPLVWQVAMCIVCLLIVADTMQRLWRHYNRTESAFRDVRMTNDALMTAQSRLEKHLHEQEELLEVSRVIRSTQEMGPLLDEILAQMKRVVDYSMASALVMRNGEVVAVRYAGQPFEFQSMIVAALIATPHWQKVLQQQQPVVLDDIYQESDFLEPFERLPAPYKPVSDVLQHSWLGLPLIVRGEVVGGLSITHRTAGYFTPERVGMAFVFANHAAVAIESSRTREEAVKAAALAERARLARELHDSVSQALFGMVLSTRTSLELIEQNPARARESMRFTLELADAALSEMRALIFELRPESLKEDGLLVAIQKQAAALVARHKLKLELDLCAEEPALPIETKEALYRIAMEAIQNTVRHAGARKLAISMRCAEALSLSIEDDGCGFDAAGEYPGHFGLHSMRERAAAVGGAAKIVSQPGQGASIEIILPAARLAPAAHVPATV